MLRGHCSGRPAAGAPARGPCRPARGAARRGAARPSPARPPRKRTRPTSPPPPPPQDKTRHLKHTLNAQFRMIHELCTFVLLNTRRESLVRATLTALHAYLSWVPVGCGGGRRRGGGAGRGWRRVAGGGGRGPGKRGRAAGRRPLAADCTPPSARARRPDGGGLSPPTPPPRPRPRPPPPPPPPQRYIFETNIVQLLLGLFPQAPFRNVTLQCLTEARAACLLAARTLLARALPCSRPRRRGRAPAARAPARRAPHAKGRPGSHVARGARRALILTPPPPAPQPPHPTQQLPQTQTAPPPPPPTGRGPHHGRVL